MIDLARRIELEREFGLARKQRADMAAALAAEKAERKAAQNARVPALRAEPALPDAVPTP